jgi:geranylgeranyl pyrophosphate synthase
VTKFRVYVEKHRNTIYRQICEYLPRREPEEHYAMVRVYTDRMGKYVRPSLLLLWAELFGGKLVHAILPAAAMQVSEDWILIHDDWEDNNRLRRGGKSAHVLHGDRFAINAGDALHMTMWKMVHDSSRRLGKIVSNKFFDKFYDMLTVTAEGQYLDMHLTYEIRDITEFTIDDYYESICAKSCYYSVYGPMQLGAVVGGADMKRVRRIEEYGKTIGYAFQIKDDILDCISTEKELGKTIGIDILNGAKTAILWHFVRNSDPSDLQNVRRIYMKSKKTKGDVSEVIKLFNKYGSVAYAQSEVDRLAKEVKLFNKYGSVAYAQSEVDRLAKEAMEKFEEVAKEIPESDMKETARDAIVKLASRNQ